MRFPKFRIFHQIYWVMKICNFILFYTSFRNYMYYFLTSGFHLPLKEYTSVLLHAVLVPLADMEILLLPHLENLL